jgi:hypothetical protein
MPSPSEYYLIKIKTWKKYYIITRAGQKKIQLWVLFEFSRNRELSLVVSYTVEPSFECLNIHKFYMATENSFISTRWSFKNLRVDLSPVPLIMQRKLQAQSTN